MKNKFLKCFTLSAVLAASALFPAQFTGNETAFAAVEKNNVISEDFNKSELGGEWIGRGSALEKEYDAMRFNGKYDYGGTVSLAGFEFGGSCEFSFTVKAISGSWFAMAFGGRNALSAFASYSFSLSFNAKQTSISQGDGGFEYTNKKTDTSSYFLDYAKTKPVTVKISLEETLENMYNAAVSYTDAETGAKAGEDFTYENIPAIGGRTYVCFNTGNMLMDILDFEAKKGGETVFSDDFSSPDIVYYGEAVGEAKWTTNANYTAEHVYIAPIGKLDLSGANAFAMYAGQMPKSNGYSEKVYDVSFQLNISEKGFSDQTVFGVGFHLSENSSRLDETKLAGIAADGDVLRPVTLSGGKLTFLAGEAIPKEEAYGRAFTVLAEALYNGNVKIKFGRYEYTYPSVEISGLIGIGCANVSGDRKNYVSIDDAEINVYQAKLSYEGDMSSDFSGLKITKDESGTDYYDYYLNAAKWHLGSGVGLPVYTKRGKSDYLMFMNSSNYSAFGPKAKYEEYMIQCDVTITSTARNGQMVGLSFGRSAYSMVTQFTTAVGFYMQVAPAAGLNRTILYTYNCTLENQSDSKTLYKEDGTEEYMWAVKNESENKNDVTRYNLMFIVKNREVGVHYKRADEDISVLGKTRAIVKNVNTYGYPAIFGLGGVGFQLRNFRIINLNPLAGD